MVIMSIGAGGSECLPKSTTFLSTKFMIRYFLCDRIPIMESLQFDFSIALLIK